MYFYRCVYPWTLVTFQMSESLFVSLQTSLTVYFRSFVQAQRGTVIQKLTKKAEKEEEVKKRKQICVSELETLRRS